MDEHMIRNYVRAEEIFVSGQGARLRDETGKEYLDLFVGTAAGEVLRLLPPYVITAAEIETALDMLGAGLTELQESRS